MIIANKTTIDFDIIAFLDTKNEEFTLTNTGTTNTEVSIVSSSVDFTCSHTSLTLFPNESQIITVAFYPQTINTYIDSLTITCLENILNINLLGTSVSAGIYVDKLSIDFSSVSINTSKINNVIISNISHDDVNLILTSVFSNNIAFSETLDSYLISKGEALQIPIVFTPSIEGNVTGQLQIESNDYDTSPWIIALSGTGTLSPNITTSIETLNFDDVQIGQSVIKTFSIYNIGVANLSITSIVSNDLSFVTSSTSAGILPNKSLEIAVTFTPTTKSPIISSITITSNDPDSPTKNIGLQGVGGSPVISVLPQVLDFGNTTINDLKVKTLSIQNSTLSTLIISNIEISNSEFSISETFPLLVSASKDIDVTFDPTTLGLKESTITLYSNDIDTPQIEILSQGTGVHPDIFVQPTSFDFGNSSVYLSSSLNLTITNLGLGKLSITSIISSNPMFIVGIDALEIESRQSKTILVTFTPTSSGTKNGILQLINNDPDTPNISLNLVGYGAFPEVVITYQPPTGIKKYFPESLNFGSAVINATNTQQLQIQNTGRVDLIVNISTNSSEFSVSSTDFIVHSGNIENVIVSFLPTSIGNFLSSININTNDAGHISNTIEVTGIGVSSAKIEVNPKSLIFSDVPVGSSQTLDLTVSNTGLQLLSFTTSVSNPLRIGTPVFFSVIPSSGHVDINNSTILSVTFRPTDLESLEGELKILSNDITEPEVKITLSGTVIPAILKWSKINTAQWVPKDIYTIATSLTQIIDPLVIALDITTQVLNIVKLFIIDISDPMKILLDQIKKTIDDFINDLSATGLYAIYIMPGQLGVNPKKYPQYFTELSKSQLSIFDVNNPSWFDCVKGGYSSFVSKLTQSFDDPGDGNRPQLSDDAMVGGYVMMFDSGTVGPDDIAKFIRSIQKLMKMFRSPFKVAFDPPSNVSCFAGNNVVRVTFTPSASILPKEYFIFRSKTQGGDVVNYTYNGRKYPYHDENGNSIRSYELIGVTNVLKQVVDITGLGEKNAETKLKELYYSAKELSKTLLNGDPLRFVYEDLKVENDQTYYYVVSAGYTTLAGNYSSMPLDIKSSDFDKKVVSTVDPNTKDLIQSEVNPRPVSDTKIMASGSLSAEVSAMPINSALEVKGGLARCRNFRCGFNKDGHDDFTVDSAGTPDFITISNTPIVGSVKIKITRNGKSFTASSSSYRVDYSPKKKEGINVKTYQGVSCKIFIKSLYYFKSGDILDVYYKYKIDLNISHKLHEPVTLDKYQTFLTLKKPIDSSSVIVYQGSSVIIPSSQVMVLNEKDGKIKVSGIALGTKLIVDYDYYSDFSDQDFFKCIRSEYSRYFFDIAKCDGGATLCPGYDNANCYYNNGSECTNTEKSERTIFNKTTGFQSENIAYNKFWDPISCQNSMMQQRCDGYSKTFPRYSPKVWPDWSSIQLSAIGLFPKIEEIMKIMQQMLNSLIAGTDKMSSSISNFIDLLQKKIDSLKNLLETIKSFLIVLTEDFVLPDLYFLRIPYGRGGSQYLKTSIENATNGPTKEPTAYTAGAMFVYASPSLGNALKLFFG